MLSLRNVGKRSSAALLTVVEIATSAIRRICLAELKAETGDAAVQFNLGMNYYRGEGAAQDYAKAYFWLDLAAAAKIEGAKQENTETFQKIVDKYRDEAASRLSPSDLIRVQEQALEWFRAHPQRLSMKLNDDTTGLASLRPGLRALVKSVGAFLVIGLFTAIGISAYSSLDDAGWITHNHDTPVWIQGNWMVGEYRTCQLLTTRSWELSPDQLPPRMKAELPRLLCGRGNPDNLSGSLIGFESEVPAASGLIWGGGDWGTFDSYFHVLPVRYNGRIDRPDELYVSWRCQRQGNSLLSSAGIICNALN